MNTVVFTKDVEAARRTLMQTAKLSIRDVYDAIVELVTNADDRYQILDSDGRIEIEVERRRGGESSLLRVRDFADGLTSQTMKTKLSRQGGRVSGLQEGRDVRGTNSRGAKDVAALGHVVFESIAEDGQYHKCEITPYIQFKLYESEPASETIRERLGISEGTGTVVTIRVDPTHNIPQHNTLCKQISQLMQLRDVVADRRREIELRDINQGRSHAIQAPRYAGKERVKVTFDVPGYSGAAAKLVICRSSRRFQRESDRFRLGGILVKSRHAIHEATLLDNGLESDPHALWFYGRLTCPYIDDLWNQFDDRFEAEEEHEPANPVPILDPTRKSGLTRSHPFVTALYREALKRLRPLVEEERRREEKQRASVESKATRRYLDALAKAALKFMREFGEENDDPSRNPDNTTDGGRVREKGYSFGPPFAQLIKGQSRRFSLSVLQEAFPELEVGASVQIECQTRDITSDTRFAALEPHPTQDGVLRAIWKIKAVSATVATGVKVRVSPITAESVVEVLESEAERYSWVDGLCFERSRYLVRTDKKRKRVRLLAPLDLVSNATPFEAEIVGRGFTAHGEHILRPDANLRVALCDFTIKTTQEDAATAQLFTRMNGRQALVNLVTTTPPGTGMSFGLEDIDLGNFRSKWKKDRLEIAARHPSLARYLGPKSEGFPGQEKRHFRVLLGEIVADAVCYRLLSQKIQANPEDYENADWDMFYFEFSQHMTRFLPIAHRLAVPDSEQLN